MSGHKNAGGGDIFRAGWERPGLSRRATAFAASLVLHVLTVSALAYIDMHLSRQGPRPLTVAEISGDQQYEVILFAPSRELPSVAPVQASANDSRATRAKLRFSQTLIVDDPQPGSSRQKIRGLMPEIKIEQDMRLPNLLAWHPPEIARPRYKMKPSASGSPKRSALPALSAPKIQAAPQRPMPATAPAVKLPAPLRYHLAEHKPQAPAPRPLTAENAPQLEAAAPVLNLEAIRKPLTMRYWTRQQEAVRPAAEAIEAPVPPKIVPPKIVAHLEKLDSSLLESQPRLRYWARDTTAVVPQETALPAGDAPAIHASPLTGAALGVMRAKPLLRYQATLSGDPAAGERAPAEQALAASGLVAPALAESVQSGGAANLAMVSYGNAAVLENLARPAPGGNGDSRANAAEEGTGKRVGKESEGRGHDGPSVLVVGVDPGGSPAIPLGSRSARLSASPDGGPGGGDLAARAPGSARLAIPNLSISGRPATSLAGTTRAGTTARGRRSAAGLLKKRDNTGGGIGDLALFQRPRDYAAPPILAASPEAPLLSNDPEILFMDREVFAMAVNMPNVTSRAGSWVIRFAEHRPRRGGRNRRSKAAADPAAQDASSQHPSAQEVLSAPAPRVKVDPKYIASAMEEGVEGTVILYALIRADGTVGAIRVMASVDDRLDESAVAALSKWRFQPATKGGNPIGVDAVVEIPFRLMPAGRVVREF